MFSKLQHRLMTEYPAVWKSDSQLALLVRLLVAADKYYPEWPTANRRNGAYQSLLKAGLVIEQEGTNGYTILGLEAERERRTDAARNAAASRWGMPSRDRVEKNREEGNGIAPPQSFIRFREKAPGEAHVPVHDGRHGHQCLVCFPAIKEKV